jgi:hypothetical protein
VYATPPVDPPEPPPSGTVPQPTNLTAPSKTSSSITLAWYGPENYETEATTLEHDYQAIIENTQPGDMPRFSNGRNALLPINEGDATLMANNKDPDGWRSYVISTEKSRKRSSTKSQKFWTYDNNINDFQSRMECHPMSESPYDKVRYRKNELWAWGFSIWIENAVRPETYQVIGQTHDVIEYAPDGRKSVGFSPVSGIRLSPLSDEGKNPPGVWTVFAGAETLAFPYDNSAKASIEYKQWDVESSQIGRWIDIVYIIRYDASGSNEWPDDGAPPYNGYSEVWIDGKRELFYEGGPLGGNDNQAKGHYPKFGIYSGWKLANYNSPPVGGWGETEQTMYYAEVKMAKGANATYENVNPSGRCTSIEVVEQINANTTSVVKTLPPSAVTTTISGLPSNSERTYFIQCRYLNEVGEPSNTITVTTS